MKPLRVLRSQRGQSLIELALLLPLLLLLLLGVIEVGRYAYIGILVGNAARAGAAYGAQTAITAADISGITAAAQSDFQSNGFNKSALTVPAAVPVCACDNGGSMSGIACTTTCKAAGYLLTSGEPQPEVVSLQVTAKATFTPLFPAYPGVPRITTLQRTATMRIGECPTCPQ